MRIVGIEDSTFTGRNGADAGQKVEGYRLFLEGPLEHEGVGIRCESVWCRKAVGDEYFCRFDSLDDVLGQEVQPLYNRGARSPSALLPLAVPAKAK